MITSEGVILELEKAKSRICGRRVKVVGWIVGSRSTLGVRDGACGVEGTGSWSSKGELALWAFNPQPFLFLYRKRHGGGGPIVVVIKDGRFRWWDVDLGKTGGDGRGSCGS